MSDAIEVVSGRARGAFLRDYVPPSNGVAARVVFVFDARRARTFASEAAAMRWLRALPVPAYRVDCVRV